MRGNSGTCIVHRSLNSPESVGYSLCPPARYSYVATNYMSRLRGTILLVAFALLAVLHIASLCLMPSGPSCPPDAVLQRPLHQNWKAVHSKTSSAFLRAAPVCNDSEPLPSFKRLPARGAFEIEFDDVSSVLNSEDSCVVLPETCLIIVADRSGRLGNSHNQLINALELLGICTGVLIPNNMMTPMPGIMWPPPLHSLLLNSQVLLPGFQIHPLSFVL